MKPLSLTHSLLLLLVIVAAAGCQTPSIRDAAPRGATSILDQLDARGEQRNIVLESDIRGSAHPRCSLMEVFLDSWKSRRRTSVKIVESNLLGLIEKEFPRADGDITDEKTRLRLGELLGADTVVVGWAGEREKLTFEENEAEGVTALKDKRWFTTYLHMVAIDIPSGRIIASWSHYPATASSVSKRICPWIRKDDVVVVQPTLDAEVKSALLAGLHRGGRGRYSIVVRDLVRFLKRREAPGSDDFFSRSSQDRLRESGVSVILGADSVMGLNLRAIDIRSGEIINGLHGPLSDHLQTSYDNPKNLSR